MEGDPLNRCRQCVRRKLDCSPQKWGDEKERIILASTANRLDLLAGPSQVPTGGAAQPNRPDSGSHNGGQNQRLIRTDGDSEISRNTALSSRQRDQHQFPRRPNPADAGPHSLRTNTPSSVPQPPSMPAGEDPFLCPNCKCNLTREPVLAQVAQILLTRHHESLHGSVRSTFHTIVQEFTNEQQARPGPPGQRTSPPQGLGPNDGLIQQHAPSMELPLQRTPPNGFTQFRDLFPSH